MIATNFGVLLLDFTNKNCIFARKQIKVNAL